MGDNKIIHIILISLFSLTVISCAKEEEKKTEAPVIAEVYPVTTPTSDSSPDYMVCLESKWKKS